MEHRVKYRDSLLHAEISNRLRIYENTVDINFLWHSACPPSNRSIPLPSSSNTITFQQFVAALLTPLVNGFPRQKRNRTNELTERLARIADAFQRFRFHELRGVLLYHITAFPKIGFDGAGRIPALSPRPVQDTPGGNCPTASPPGRM